MEFNDPAKATREEVEEAIKNWRMYRQKRLDEEKIADKTKEKENAFKSFVLEAFKQQKFEGMIIDGRSTGLSTKKVAAVEDKESFVAHILATGQIDLLQFRLSEGAVKERWANEEEVPGVGEVEVYDLFDRKV